MKVRKRSSRQGAEESIVDGRKGGLMALGLAIAMALVGPPQLVQAWDPLPVREDPRVFMPGSQPGSASLESVSRCDNCHGGYDSGVEPAHTWYGSMMAQAMRDPLLFACMTVAGQDSIWALGNPNAVDLCLRCHTPGGWLGGRSDPPNGTALAGSDFEGVNCDACHVMIDPFNALRQLPDVAVETNPSAQAMSEATYQRDLEVLRQFVLFDDTPFLNEGTRLPTFYGSGEYPGYVEAVSGQFFVDAGNEKRGQRFDADPTHQLYYSRFHKSKAFCSTCHDVSNPALAHVVLGPGTAERQAGGSYFHVERTWSEFQLSAFARLGGTNTRPALALRGIPWADSCQDCHMRDVTGQACNKQGVAVRSDLALHDLTGGNAWMAGILASVDPNGPVYDPYNFAVLSGDKYAGASIDTAGLRRHGQALVDGQQRALEQLRMAATLELVSESEDSVILRIWNNTGHKLTSGFPEGRRMWLNVQFFNDQGALVEEINPYEPLVVRKDSEGNEVYVSGGNLVPTRDDLVYEAAMSSALTGESKTFHFVLATDRYKDNRIPPRGFDVASAPSRLVQPRWHGEDAPDYFTPVEYEEGYDEVSLIKPDNALYWRASLYYQTTSREYITFLRDEINGVNQTLTSGSPEHPESPYLAQTDPFFATLRDWGKAIWDLWLHNAGSGPVLMTSLTPTPRLLPARWDAEGVRIRFQTEVGWEYQIQRVGELPATAWIDVGPEWEGDGTVKEFIDTNALASPRGFYRVLVETNEEDGLRIE